MREKKRSWMSSGNTKINRLINQGSIKNKIASFVPLGDRRVINLYFL